MTFWKKSNRRNFLKNSGLALAGAAAASIKGLDRAQAFVAYSARRARAGLPTLFGWGNNYSSVLSVSPAGTVSSPISANTKIWTKIVSSDSYSLGITSDGALWAWGDDANGGGVIGNGTVGNIYSSPVRIGTSTWIDVANNFDAALAIRSDGTLWGWGRNYNDVFPANLDSDANSVGIYLGNSPGWSYFSVNNKKDVGCNSIAVQTNGVVYGYGANESYQLGLWDNDIRSGPTTLISSIWKTLSCGTEHTMGIKTTGALWSMGNNLNGACGNGITTSTYRSTPTVVGTATNWSLVSAGNNCSVMIKTDGTLWFTGYGADGTSGAGTTSVSTPVQSGSVNTWAKISLRERHALAIQTTGTLWAWGSNTAGAVGNSSAAALVSTPIQIGSATNWSEVAAGVATSMAIKSDGTLWAWGNNDKGQLGIGTTTNVSSPVRVGTTTWTKVSTADYITAAVRSDGTMWVWGMLDGFTSYGTVSTPIQIQSETVWVDVKVGPNYIMLVKNDTSVWTMGVNFYGQMGGSIEARYSSPVQMGSATNWKKISFQDYAGVAAIKTDNTLWNWGWIYWVDTLAYSFYRLKTPVQVGTATDWADVKAIACNFLALKSTGTLWSWGLNRAKNGLSTALGDSSTPSQIGALTTWSKIAMNTTSSYGIKRDGTLWSWGAPLYGELGQGASSGGSSPVQVGSSTLWTDISAHSYSALAIEWPGKAYGWGINDFGQIGISSLTNVSTPVQIGTKFDWKKVFAGAHSGYGRRDI